jgi:hypothetical protein
LDATDVDVANFNAVLADATIDEVAAELAATLVKTDAIEESSWSVK